MILNAKLIRKFLDGAEEGETVLNALSSGQCYIPALALYEVGMDLLRDEYAYDDILARFEQLLTVAELVPLDSECVKDALGYHAAGQDIEQAMYTAVADMKGVKVLEP